MSEAYTKPRYVVSGVVQIQQAGRWSEHPVQMTVAAWSALEASTTILKLYEGDVVRWHSLPSVREERP